MAPLAQLNLGSGATDLPRDKVLPSARRFVVVGNGVAGEKTMMVAINSLHLRGEGLGAPIGGYRAHGSVLGLRRYFRRAEDFTQAGMEKFWRRCGISEHFQYH